MSSVEIYLGLGSNLGDRLDNLVSAVRRLSQKMAIKELSSVYETEPVGYKAQSLFLNAAISAVTRFDAFQLLHFVKDIESDLGRQPSFRNAPRIIDIDILFYGDSVIQTEELVIPHAGIAERAFVLVPLAEIAPKLVHPQLKRKVSELLAEVDGRDGVRKFGEL